MHFCLEGFHLVLKRNLWRDLRLNRCLSRSRISFSYLCPASWYFTVPTVSPFLRQRVAFLGLFFIPCLLLLLLIMDLGHRGAWSARDRQYERWVSFASLWLPAVEVINFLLGWGPYQGLGHVVSTLPPSYDLTLLFHFDCRDRVLTNIPRPGMTWNSLGKLILELAVMCSSASWVVG